MILPRAYLAKVATTTSAGGIIGWWEIRRLYYNVIVIVALVIASVWQVAEKANRGPFGTELWSTLLSGFVLILIPANIWYTGGWVVDLIVKKVLRLASPGFGPWALALGTIFSLLFIGFLFVHFGFSDFLISP